MPNIKANKKHLKKSIKRQLHNKSIKSRIRTVEKGIVRLLDENKIGEAGEKLNYFYKIADKASKKKILKNNTVSRKKSKLAKKISSFKESDSKIASSLES